MHCLLYKRCRWLKEWGIALSSERQQRKCGKELLGDNLAAEAVPFSFPLKMGGEEIRAAPMAYTPDLIAKILACLKRTASKTKDCYRCTDILHVKRCAGMTDSPTTMV
jgi:hypothetical protein